MDNLGLMFENEIILKSSYANIHYGSPFFNSDVTFTLHADDEVEGFTMKELALKVMQRYHLLGFLYKNYNMDEGKIQSESSETDLFTTKPKSDKYCFRPVLYDSEIFDNGVMGVEYNKDKDHWTIMMYDYV
jgi:hypothetical protein